MTMAHALNADNEDLNPQVAFLANIATQILRLPFGFALAVSVLIGAAFMLFGIVLVAVIVMGKLLSGGIVLMETVTNHVAERAAATAPASPGPTKHDSSPGSTRHDMGRDR